MRSIFRFFFLLSFSLGQQVWRECWAYSRHGFGVGLDGQSEEPMVVVSVRNRLWQAESRNTLTRV